MSGPSGAPDPFHARLVAAGATSLAGVRALESAQRLLDPPRIPELREGLAGALPPLEEALAELENGGAPMDLERLRDDLIRACRATRDALKSFLDESPAHPVAGVLEAMHLHASAQRELYALRSLFPPLGRYFAEAAWWERLAELDPPPVPGIRVGLHQAGAADDPRARGGFSLYVPERYDGSRALPLVVALHGGMGHGADFLWTWLREARSRQLLLLAPTSRGTTWSMDAPRVDGRALRSMIDFVSERWRVDPERILLTGLSDGATFSLLAGLEEDAPYTAIAPVSGVLHPLNFASGNLARARGRRIYLVHGARDWMFPIQLARAAQDALRDAGAALEFREIADLSHTYPREENDRILRWFDPVLSLPEARAKEPGAPQSG